MTTEIQSELDHIDLGDQRLNRRAGQILDSFWADPQASINAASHGWAESQAAYRFFDNKNVQAEKILWPHQQATNRRIAQHAVVLLAQDTTELDFSDHPPQGAGPLTSEARLGFLDHSQIAFTPDGLCLGMIDVNIWARSREGFGDSKKRQHDPIETKETYRWLEGYRKACELAGQVPQTQIISVADSEGDIYELFVEAQQCSEKAAEFVIRAGKIRSLPELDPQGGPSTYCKLQKEINHAPLVAVRELELPRTPKRKARTATLEIRAQRVRLKAPYRKHTALPEVEINVVLVRETNAPPGEEAVEWLLVTSLPIDTPEQVLLVVDYYRGRWPIEIFFRVYKTGCQVEQIQLETSERLLRCLMLYKIIAWRVLYLTMLGRECPELPCDMLFTPDEWKPVWKITCDDPLPATAPPLGRFLLLLAKLGGHNGRRRDAAPGPQSLWVGIRRLTDFAIAWRAFGPDKHAPPPNDKKRLVCN
jgi:hypothetical protein